MSAVPSCVSPRPPCVRAVTCTMHPISRPMHPTTPAPPRVRLLEDTPPTHTAFCSRRSRFTMPPKRRKVGMLSASWPIERVSSQTQSSDDDDEFVPTADVEPVRPRSGRAAASRQVIRAQAAAMYEADLDAALLQDDGDAAPVSSRSKRAVKSRAQPPSYAEPNSDAEYDYAPAQEKAQRKKAAKAAVVMVEGPPADAEVSVPPADDEPASDRVRAPNMAMLFFLTRSRRIHLLMSVRTATSLAQTACCPSRSTKYFIGGEFNATIEFATDIMQYLQASCW